MSTILTASSTHTSHIRHSADSIARINPFVSHPILHYRHDGCYVPGLRPPGRLALPRHGRSRCSVQRYLPCSQRPQQEDYSDPSYQRVQPRRGRLHPELPEAGRCGREEDEALDAIVDCRR